MSYTINKFGGEQLIVLEDGTIDTSTTLGLVGRNYVGYGETQNENFVWLLENFANSSPPARPLQGQTWYNSDTKLLHVYDGAKWVVVGAAVLSLTAPEDAAPGELWLNTTSNQLYVWDGVAWQFIGPENVAGFSGITRAQSTTLLDSTNVLRPVILIKVSGTVIAICSSMEFTINPSVSVPGFANLVAGITISTLRRFAGDIDGTATRATRLETPRNINGISFDGTYDIAIRSSTTKSLIKGDYIVGSNFDGSTETTWSVNASSENSIGKVVARNSSGGFSAGTINADLVGNVTGNVTSSGTSNFNIVRATQFIGPTLSGNADTATQLQTARTINGVSFNGTANITVTANAQTLTGTYINSGVTESSLVALGVLRDLSVANAGITLGSGNQLRILVEGSTPTIRSATGTLNFDMGDTGPDVSFINAVTSTSLSGPPAPAIIGDNTTNLGIPGYTFNNIYANTLVGNAQTATLAVRATNIVGGSAGSLPYQTASGTTTMLPIATPGYVLKTAGGGALEWAAPTFEGLKPGEYLALKRTDTGVPLTEYSTVYPTTIYVDATTSNTFNKVVARDPSGNFAAGIITASLNGNASTATNATYATTAGSATTAVTATNATNSTNASYSVTQANFDGSTKIATTRYVDNMVNLLAPAKMVISAPSPNLSSPDAQYADLINAYIPASAVTPGTLFQLTINVVYAGTDTSISASRWIMAYQWGTLSVGATTNLYNSSTGFKLTYSSNGSSWTYTGAWSYV
jgi:hypothetical protein